MNVLTSREKSSAQSAESLRNDVAPPLEAKSAPWMRRLLADQSKVAELVSQNGSPLHIVVKSEFERNASDLLSPLKARGVAGNLFFARKANKLPWFVEAARDLGLGVDTASLRELNETLALGVTPERIVVTAIGKSEALVEKAVSEGVLIVVDSFDELELVNRVSQRISSQKAARLGLRFSGFEVEKRKVGSRFGFDVSEAQVLFAALGEFEHIRIEILHAHIDKYDTVERAMAARKLIELAVGARRFGHHIRCVDIGGGILMRYLDSQAQWEEFLSQLHCSVQGARPWFTFNNNAFGLKNVEGRVGGEPELYPAWNDLSKERFVSAVLDHENGGVPLWKEFVDAGLELAFEPGRALLDNCGVTLSSVMFRKRDTKSNLLIGLAMNRMNLRPFRAEFCSDPILVHTGSRRSSSIFPEIAREPGEGAFLVGCLCSESDFIYQRRLALQQMPLAGDIFCFLNTAGYLMHHMEIGTHGDQLPRNVLVDSESLIVERSL